MRMFPDAREVLLPLCSGCASNSASACLQWAVLAKDTNIAAAKIGKSAALLSVKVKLDKDSDLQYQLVPLRFVRSLRVGQDMTLDKTGDFELRLFETGLTGARRGECSLLKLEVNCAAGYSHVCMLVNCYTNPHMHARTRTCTYLRKRACTHSYKDQRGNKCAPGTCLQMHYCSAAVADNPHANRHECVQMQTFVCMDACTHPSITRTHECKCAPRALTQNDRSQVSRQ